MSVNMGNSQAPIVKVVDSEVVESIGAQGITPCIENTESKDVTETIEGKTAALDSVVAEDTKSVELLVYVDAKSVEQIVAKGVKIAEPVVSEIAEPVVSEITESVVSEITESVVSEITESVVSEVAEPVTAQITDPVVADTAEPEAAKIADPVAVEVAEPVVAKVAEPVVAKVAEPVVAKVAEPVVAKVAEPVVAKVAEPVVAEAAEPVVVKFARLMVAEVSKPVVAEDSEASEPVDGKKESANDKTSSESNMELKTNDEIAKIPEDSNEDKSIATAKVSNSTLKSQSMDHVSVLSLAGSADSDITPPPTCFMWFKKYSSPQRLMSKIMHKRDGKSLKSQKSDLPSLESAVSDPKDSSSEVSSEDCGKIYENIFLGVFMPPQNEIERIDYASLAEEKIIPAYLGVHPSYDVMPTSGKVIILSVELLVKNAFSALVSNDIKAAPLWDAGVFDFVGMLTISDFINVLRHYYYSSPEDIKDIENQSIATWRRITKVEKPFVKVNGSDSLVQATKLLIQEGVHRIPVFDEKRQSVLFVLTRKRLLHFLSNSLFENFEKTNVKTPSFFRKTIRELKVGTFEDIATVEVTTKVIDALDLFVKRKVSSLPVVEKDNILIDIFEKFDVFQLAKEQTYHNLDMPIKEAICKADVRETAWICTLDETFGTVINRFVNNKVHRIVVINDKRAVVGIISLSDVLKFLVLNPLENSSLPSTAETIEEGSEGAVGGTSTEQSSLDSVQKADSLDEEDSSTVSEAVENLKLEDPKVE